MGGNVFSANIATDTQTGIGNWSREAFIQRFRYFGDYSFLPVASIKGAFNTVVPWAGFGKMTTKDLSAIYSYLRTIKPIRNYVPRFIAISQ